MFQDPTFWVAVAFVITVAAVYKPISRMLLSGLDKRSERIREQLEEAQLLREEAQKTLAEYKRMQRDAVQEADSIIERAKSEAENMRAEAEANLGTQLERREKLALEKISQAEATALKEVRDRSVDLAIAATARLLGEQIDAGKADQLVEESIKELSEKLH